MLTLLTLAQHAACEHMTRCQKISKEPILCHPGVLATFIHSSHILNPKADDDDDAHTYIKTPHDPPTQQIIPNHLI